MPDWRRSRSLRRRSPRPRRGLGPTAIFGAAAPPAALAAAGGAAPLSTGPRRAAAPRRSSAVAAQLRRRMRRPPRRAGSVGGRGRLSHCLDRRRPRPPGDGRGCDGAVRRRQSSKTSSKVVALHFRVLFALLTLTYYCTGKFLIASCSKQCKKASLKLIYDK